MSLIAVNKASESAVSNAVAVTPAPTAPDAPQITNIEPGNGQVSISVSMTDDGGSPITGYNAYCFGDTLSFDTSSTSPITVSGLTNGEAYTCAVTATNDIGDSPASAFSEPVTPEVDTDGDGVNDLLDNCVSIANPDQTPSAINPNCGEACVTSGCAGPICENH
jgi:hypothetical protein